MAKLSTESVITDTLWGFAGPLIPEIQRPAPANHPVDARAALAAIVYSITTDTPWAELPVEFGITPATAQRRFHSWNSYGFWRDLALAAIGTPHARWACTVADAAIHRTAHRAGSAPFPGKSVQPEPTPDDYAAAREAMNNPSGLIL